MRQKTRKSRYSWALYDWANSAFAVVVLSGFFPIYFREFWAKGLDSNVITWYLGVANSSASLIFVLIAPLLGAIAGRGGLKKQMLIFASVFAMLMTTALFWLEQGMWPGAVALFILSTLGWMAANIFYDALLVDVANPKDYNRVSALGYAFGYLGGGILFSLCVAMTLKPAVFGLASASQAVSLSFLLVAAWWACFSIPLWLWVHEPKATASEGILQASRDGLAVLITTISELSKARHIALFLLAYWFYIDGVDTVIRMAVDYGKTRGIGNNDLITALLVTQFIGFPAALVFGHIGEKIGAKYAILLGIGVYCVITIAAAFMDDARDFFILAGCVGLVQGGVQALSRAFYAALIPADKAAEYFGLYNMVGKFAAIIGPVLVGWVGLKTGGAEYGLLSLLVLFICGGILLWRVNPAND